MDKAREILAYTKMNFQRCFYQGKAVMVLLCIFAFLQMYFGNVRGVLLQAGETLDVSQFFLAVTNTNYTSFTIWTGYVFLVCDIPYREEGIYQYLLRTSKKSWLCGQFIFLIGVTLAYFAFIYASLLLLLFPAVGIDAGWSTTFIRLINTPNVYGIQSFFYFPISSLRFLSPDILFLRCFVLFFLGGLATGFLTMMVNMLWTKGPGILTGGMLLILNFWITRVESVGREQLLFVSPMSMARIGNISAVRFDKVHPGFLYSCCFLLVLLIMSLLVMRWKMKTYEFS